MTAPLGHAIIVGIVTFVAAYIVLMGFAMVRFAYGNGPIPDLLLGIPVPLIIAAFAATLAFRIKSSD